MTKNTPHHGDGWGGVGLTSTLTAKPHTHTILSWGVGAEHPHPSREQAEKKNNERCIDIRQYIYPDY